MKTIVRVLLLVMMAFAQSLVIKEFKCKPGYDQKVVGQKLTCAKLLTAAEAATKLEEFADTFVPKTRILIRRYKDAQTWAEIAPDHPEAIKLREEISGREPEQTILIQNLQRLVEEMKPTMTSETLIAKDLEAAKRGLAAVKEMQEFAEEVLKQARRYHAVN